MAKLVDTATIPNLGLQTAAEFFQIPEMAADYQTPFDIDDTFVELAHCVNAVWARFVRTALFEINEVFACRKNVPLSDKIAGGGGGGSSGDHWRAGHDNSHRISDADFPATGPGEPEIWVLDGFPDRLQGGANDFVDAVVVGDRRMNYGVVSMPEDIDEGLEGLVGLVNSGVRYYWLESTGKADASDIFFHMTLRIPAWNQANNGVVLAAVRRFDIAAETGATDGMAWEFGLGTRIDGAVHISGAVPTGTEQDRVLYLRYYTASGTQVVQVAAVRGLTAAQYSIQPGPEWGLGFHRIEEQGGTMTVRFYINGERIAEEHTGLPAADSVGSSPSIRLVLGSRENGIQFAGGPMRNVYFWNDEDIVDEGVVKDVYEKTAGFTAPAVGGG